MFQNKSCYTFLILIACPLLEYSQGGEVHDSTTHAILQQNNQSELAKWAESLGKLDQQLQKATDQVTRLTDIQKYIGDPGSTFLPGDSLGAIGSIYRSTTSIYRNVNEVAALATGDPSGALNGLGGMYSMEDALWYLEKEGYKFDQKRYQRYSAARRAAEQADQMNKDTITDLNKLNDELTNLQNKLNTATTQSEIEKLNGLISATQSKIAALEARRRATADTQTLIHLQNENDATERKEKISEALGNSMGNVTKSLNPEGGKRKMTAVAGN